MKIAEIISDTNVGGAGRVLIERLKKCKNCDAETVVLLPRGSRLKARIESIEIQVIEFDGCADRSLDIKAIFNLKNIISSLEVDVVNTHGCLSGRIAAFLCGVPVRIYTRHCAYPVPIYQRCFPIKQLLGRFNLLLSPYAIAVADAAAKNLTSMGYPNDRIHVIINGVEGLRRYTEEDRITEREKEGLDGCFVVGICARIEACKDHKCFLRAARILANDDESYRFVIVGEGSLIEEIKALAKELKIADKVIFTGFCDDVERWFNCFDVNVNCSIGTETSSLALSEGMSIGLPSVASSYGGNPYMVCHGENGFIYSAGDASQLAQMIQMIKNDPELYESMSKKALERFSSELNSQRMCADTLELYRNLYRKSVDIVSAVE